MIFIKSLRPILPSHGARLLMPAWPSRVFSQTGRRGVHNPGAEEPQKSSIKGRPHTPLAGETAESEVKSLGTRSSRFPDPPSEPEPGPDFYVNMEPDHVIDDSFEQAVKAGCPVECAIGVDICDISRVEEIADRSRASYLKFSSRLLTPLEIKLQRPLAEDGEAEHTKRRAQFLAGRWAAKEAIIKAVSAHNNLGNNRKTFMHDIIILPAPVFDVFTIRDVERGIVFVGEGKSPAAALQKGPLRAFVRTGAEETSNKWLEVMVSISHDGGNAIAVAFVASPESRKIIEITPDVAPDKSPSL